MNPYQINFVMRLSAIGLIAAVPVAVAAGLLLRLDSPDTVISPRVAGRPIPHAATTVPSVESFGAVLDRRLRPTFDDGLSPPANTPLDAASTPATSNELRLVGTVGTSIAMVKGPDDTIALVEVGDDVEGADVVAIGEQRVDLRRNGRLIRLEKTPPKAGGDGIVIR